MSERETINPGWDYYEKLTFAPAVRKGNMLFISGQDASQLDPVTNQVKIEGDILQQTRVIYEKIKAILEAVGASFDDVVKTTDYIIAMDNYTSTAQVRREYFGESFPASSGFIVKGLISKDALIEIDAVAVIDL